MEKALFSMLLICGKFDFEAILKKRRNIAQDLNRIVGDSVQADFPLQSSLNNIFYPKKYLIQISHAKVNVALRSKSIEQEHQRVCFVVEGKNFVIIKHVFKYFIAD